MDPPPRLWQSRVQGSFEGGGGTVPFSGCSPVCAQLRSSSNSRWPSLGCGSHEGGEFDRPPGLPGLDSPVFCRKSGTAEEEAEEAEQPFTVYGALGLGGGGGGHHVILFLFCKSFTV